MVLRNTKLIGPLLLGLACASLTWLMIGNLRYRRPTGIAFEYLGEVIMILLFPGCLGSIVVSGYVHAFSIWIAVLGNFLFYFGLAYLVRTLREKRKVKS